MNKWKINEYHAQVYACNLYSILTTHWITMTKMNNIFQMFENELFFSFLLLLLLLFLLQNRSIQWRKEDEKNISNVDCIWLITGHKDYNQTTTTKIESMNIIDSGNVMYMCMFPLNTFNWMIMMMMMMMVRVTLTTTKN